MVEMRNCEQLGELQFLTSCMPYINEQQRINGAPSCKEL